MVGDSSQDALHITPDQRRQLIDHALEGGEDEVCGILAGRESTLERIFPIRNAASDIAAESGVFRDRESGVSTPGRKTVHYYMDTNEQARTHHYIEDELGLDVIGAYHSHTHSEARPSATDVRLAYDAGTLVYVLIGLRDRNAPELRAWRIVKPDPWGEAGEPVEVPILAN